jgi:hypothetical protein
VWLVFEEYRGQLASRKLKEVDDAYREVAAFMTKEQEAGKKMPAYSAVVVDETQDLGPQALKLLRAIMPAGNNDLFFPKDFYNQIILNEISFLTYPVISPNIITEDGLYQNPHVINEISKFRELMYDVYFLNYTLAKIIKKIALITNYFTDRSDETFHDKSQIIYQGHGSCYILTPKFFEHFQELFAPTFLMGEEFFLSLQLKQKNLNLFYESNICLTHKWHSSINNVPARKIWEISRESHRIYRKYIKII